MHPKDTIFVKLIESNSHDSLIHSLTKPDTIIAFVAIIISIVGFFYSVRYNRKTFKLTKEHNILTAKPIITFLYKTHLINKRIVIKLSNSGLGPAILDKIIYKYNELSFENIDDLISKLRETKIIDFSFKLIDICPSEISINFCLSEKDKLDLYKCNIVETSQENVTKLFDIFGKIEIQVIYKDIFENIYQTKEILIGSK
jgi:hypothetical protein